MRNRYIFPLICVGLLLLVGMAAAQTTTTPPAQNPPAAAQDQAPATQSAPSAQAHRQNSIDDELGLSPDQKQKIAAIVDDENDQIGKVRDDKTMTMDQKQQKVLEIRQVGAPKIKAILTPEQLQKLAAIQERNRQQQENQQAAPPKQ